MEFIRPASWSEALEARSAHPYAVPIAGGTDVMVEVNFGRTRPPALLDLSGIEQLAEWSERGGRLRIGAGVSYTRVMDELRDQLPGLAIASRTVGSPQIRNRGTLGGNLGSASPAGDALPPLLAANAVVEAHSVRGRRMVDATEFFAGPRRTVLAPDELIAAVHVDRASGPQQFAKVGPRNAMVIAVCSVAIAMHPKRRRVGTGLGSVAAVPLRAAAAEDFLAVELADQWERPGPLGDALRRRFGELVAAASAPIDDVRSSAQYRRHALAVLARRTLDWAWEEYRTGRMRCA